MIYDRVTDGRDRSERAQRLSGSHFAHDFKIAMRPLHPQGAVGIQKNVLSTRIAEASCDKRPQLTSQLLVPPDYDLLQLDHSVPNLWLASLYSACYMYLARSMKHLCTLRFRACQGGIFYGYQIHRRGGPTTGSSDALRGFRDRSVRPKQSPPNATA